MGVMELLQANASKAVNQERTFPAILTHIGVNNNGLELTREEAKLGVDKQKGFIYLLLNQEPIKDAADFHKKSAGNIFGRGFDLRFVEDGANSRVEFTGEAYNNRPEDNHALQVIQDAFFDYDSYEVDYEEGECSKCGKRFKSYNETCNHLGRRGPMVVGTKSAHVIMHGVVFKGAAFLDRPGGDPKAGVIKVQAVACLISNSNRTEEQEMAEEKKTPKAKTEEGQPNEQEDLKAQVAKLSEQIKELTAEKDALQKTVDEFEAEKKATRVEALIALQEGKGIAFDDKSREEEKSALMEMDDAGLGREEKRINRLPDPSVSDDGDGAGDSTPPKGKASAPDKPSLSAQADAETGNKPKDVPDPDSSIGETGTGKNLAVARRKANFQHISNEEG